MAQTNYSPGLLPSLPGMLADLNPLVTESGYNSESSAEAAFGAPVRADVLADRAFLLSNLATPAIYGLVVHDDSYDPRVELGATGVKSGGKLTILRAGRITVKAGTGAVTKGARAYYQSSSGGWVTTSAMDTIDTTKQAVFASSAAAGGICVLEVDFRNAP
jgi:hypothetical protein